MCVEVPHLRYVVAAADHSSFRRAAAALNITQPTLSKRIRELEGKLGVFLFQRSPRGAELTPIGEAFEYATRRHMRLWSERIMAAFPKDHPLAVRDFVYWTDLKNERFRMSRRDPGPEIQDVLINKLTSPGDRPIVKLVNAEREVPGGR